MGTIKFFVWFAVLFLVFLWHAAAVTFTGENLFTSFLPRINAMAYGFLGKDTHVLPAGTPVEGVWVLFAVYTVLIYGSLLIGILLYYRLKRARRRHLTGAKKLRERIDGTSGRGRKGK